MAKDWTLDDIKAAKKPNIESRSIALDPEWAKRYEAAADAKTRAERAVAVAKNKTSRDAAKRALNDAEAELDDAEAGRDEAVLEFQLQGIGPGEYDELVQANQPTAQQRREASDNGDTLMWNPHSFPQALIAACLVSPKLTEDEVNELWSFENWMANDSTTLFEGAMQACTRQFSLGS